MRQAAKRFLEIDVLRGFAVLAIFWVNIVYLGWPYGAADYPTLFGGAREFNEWAWGFVHLLVEGAMFALFSMLFGASSLMLLDAARLTGGDGLRAVDQFYRRNLWLILFGLLHAFLLLWPLEILFTYGVLGLALFPLRNLGPRTLVLAGVAMVVWGTYPLQLLVPDPQDAGPQIRQEAPHPLSTRELVSVLGEEMADMREEMALYHSGYRDIFLANIDAAVHQQTANLYQDNVWDAGGMMLVGMALFKWGVLTGHRSRLFYLLMTLLGFAAGVFLRLPGVDAGITSGFAPSQVQRLGSVPHLAGRLPLALGYVGLIMLLCRRPWPGRLLRALAAAGRMAFTHYVGQTLVSILLFYGFGLGMFGRFPYYQMLLIALLAGGIQLLCSVVWLRYFHQGPLEWLWRSLVKMERQPFRKPPAPSANEPPADVSEGDTEAGRSATRRPPSGVPAVPPAGWRYWHTRSMDWSTKEVSKRHMPSL